ncbi:hypothetical protein NPIL_273861 [Nephila pilipes]|uniref:Uncharacterized protein n=1 Tax=Nephila pilipes TaxID=299642 RepID=A0A8X6Q8M7_NEPPI|nr:hypothetical protein NPIL_273861 [Nephila pilipes]
MGKEVLLGDKIDPLTSFETYQRHGDIKVYAEPYSLFIVLRLISPISYFIASLEKPLETIATYHVSAVIKNMGISPVVLL